MAKREDEYEAELLRMYAALSEIKSAWLEAARKRHKVEFIDNLTGCRVFTVVVDQESPPEPE